MRTSTFKRVAKTAGVAAGILIVIAVILSFNSLLSIYSLAGESLDKNDSAVTAKLDQNKRKAIFAKVLFVASIGSGSTSILFYYLDQRNRGQGERT